MSSGGGDLVDVFLTAVSGPDRFATSELTARLGELVEAAEATWPTLRFDRARFVRGIAEQLDEGGDGMAALGGVRTAELYIAMACASGNPEAIRAFETRYMPVAAAALSRFKNDLDFRNEALQELRIRLFSPERPRIGDYDGRGSIEGWLRVTAVRVGLNLIEKAARHVPVEDSPATALADLVDPELDILKTRYRAQFTASLRDAFAELAPEPRRILRFYLIDRLNIGEIGALVGWSRATVGRRVVEYRQALLEATRARLRAQLGGASTGEIDSVIRLVGSRFDLTVTQLLADA